MRRATRQRSAIPSLTEIVERLTETMVSIEGANLRQVTWVVVEEVKSGEWGIAGKPLTTEAVRKLAAGD
jgi:4-oxalocrotonate tautomerase